MPRSYKRKSMKKKRKPRSKTKSKSRRKRTSLKGFYNKNNNIIKVCSLSNIDNSQIKSFSEGITIYDDGSIKLHKELTNGHEPVLSRGDQIQILVDINNNGEYDDILKKLMNPKYVETCNDEFKMRVKQYLLAGRKYWNNSYVSFNNNTNYLTQRMRNLSY